MPNIRTSVMRFLYKDKEAEGGGTGTEEGRSCSCVCKRPYEAHTLTTNMLFKTQVVEEEKVRRNCDCQH